MGIQYTKINFLAYRSGMTWLNNDRFIIFGWTKLLTNCCLSTYITWKKSHNQRSFIVLTVLLKGKEIDAESCHGIQECKNGYGDEELCWGWVIPNQEETLTLAILAGGGIEIHLMEPRRDTGEQDYWESIYLFTTKAFNLI